MLEIILAALLAAPEHYWIESMILNVLGIMLWAEELIINIM